MICSCRDEINSGGPKLFSSLENSAVVYYDRFGSSSDPSINVTLMILIGHLMKLSLTKLENITVIIITDPLRPSHL